METKYTHTNSEEIHKKTGRWQRSKPSERSPLDLQDFVRFLTQSDAHKSNELICIRLNVDDPLEVTFLSGDEAHETVFRITQDHIDPSFIVTCSQGDEELTEPFLEDFGYSRVEDEIKE